MEDNRSFLKPKMMFPSYDGSNDVLLWINCYGLYFYSENTPEHKKVWMASLHMTDATQLWYYLLETVRGEPDRRHLCQLVNRQFGQAIVESPLGNLALLSQMSAVEDYAK